MGKKGRLFLTGGGGMVGRNILAHPAAKDWTILSPSSSELDLTDVNAVEAFFTEQRPSFVIHAAGRVGGIHMNMAQPVAFLDQNMMMGRNVVMSARNAGVRRFLNIASTNMYPSNGRNPLSEDLLLTGPLDPLTEGYALAKIVTMRLCDYIRREDSQMSYKTLIPCNLYGPYDKFDPKHSHLLPAIIHKVYGAMIQGTKNVEIWGDGTARREFMFVGDLADAIWKAVSDIDDLPGAMNVGHGYDYTINEYYQIVADVIGWDGSFVHDLSKPVGIQQKLCSVARQTEWGWQASSTLRDGIEQTYRYYLEHYTA